MTTEGDKQPIEATSDLSDRLGRLRNDLLAYGRHMETCALFANARDRGWKYAKLIGCSCGLDKAIKDAFA